METKFKIVGIITILIIATISVIGIFFIYGNITKEAAIKPSDNKEKSFRRFIIGNHNFSSIEYGDVKNPYFNLTIGYRITLEGEEEGADLLVNMTVLNQTEMVLGIETRVIEEREYEDGELVEVSYNYYAICNETNEIIYFGESVDIYEDGVLATHEGQWRADAPDSEAGIYIPGTFIIGDRYYQEYCPEVALDRAKNIVAGAIFSTPKEVFSDCVITEETTPLEPLVIEYKVYAPNIGQIADGRMVITYHGTVSV